MKHHCSHTFTVLLLSLFTLTCASTPKSKGAYQRYVKDAEACCNALGNDAARQQCNSEIPRVDEAYSKTHEVDREAACFDQHFACEPTTGKPTAASAQKIHDCMN